MPITLDQKRQLVVAHGLSPDQYTTDDEGTQLIPITDVPTQVTNIQPTVGPEVFTPKIIPIPQQWQTPQQPVQPTSNNTPLQTFGKSFAQEALPSVGTGLGAAGGLALGGALAPETGGLSLLIPLIASIAGGFGGGALTRKAQSLVEPESWQSNVQQAQQENPKSAFAGQLATLPLAGFNPSPSNVIKAGGALSKLATTIPFGENATQVLSNPEIQNLMNVGLGAGIGAGSAGAEQLVHGGPLNIKDILLSGATGALFNKPNRIGKALGFHSQDIPSIYDELQGSLVPTPPDTGATTPIAPTQPFNPSDAQMLQNRPINPVPGPLATAAERSNKMAGYKATPEDVSNQLAQMEAEGGANVDVLKEIEAERQRQIAELEALRKQRLAEYQQNKRELKAREADLTLTPEGEKIPSFEDIAQNKFSQESELPNALTKTQEESLPELKQYSPTRKWFETFKNYGIKSKGITIDDSGEVVDSQGNPVAGETLLENDLPKLIRLNLNKAGADTPPHELYHAFIATLRNSGRPADKRLVSRYDNIVSNDPDYIKWKGERESAGLDGTPEEYQATNAGYEFLKKFLNTDKESSWSKWKNDFGSYLKTRFGKHATTEDYQRLLNNYMVNDTRRLGPLDINASSAGATVKNQQDSELTNGKEIADKLGLIHKQWPDEVPVLGGMQSFTDPKTGLSIEGIKPGTTLGEVSRRMNEKLGIGSKYSLESLLKEWDQKTHPKNIREFLQDELNDNEDTKLKELYLKANGVNSSDKDLIKKTIPEVGSILSSLKAYDQWKNDKLGKYAITVSDANLGEYINNHYPEWANLSNTYYMSVKKAAEVFAHGKLLEDNIDVGNSLKDPQEWMDTRDYVSDPDLIKFIENMVHDKYFENNGDLKSKFSTSSALPNLNSRAEEINQLNKGKTVDKLNWSTSPIFRSQLDEVRRIPGKESKIAAQAFEQLFPRKDNIYGELMAPVLRSIKDNKLTKEDIQKVNQIGIAESRDKTSYSDQLTPSQKSFYDTIKSSVTKYAPKGKSEFYWPNQISPQAVEVLTKHPTSVLADNLHSDFVQHQVDQGMTPKDAETKWEQLVRGYAKGKPNMTRFNPIRNEESLTLPDSMLRNEPLKDLHRYFTRVASDRAWNQVVESNPDASKVLGLKSDSSLRNISEERNVKDILEHIHGDTFDEGERKLKTYNRIATSLMLGPLTNVHIMAGSMANTLNHMGLTEAPKAFSYALTHMSDSYQHTLETGYNKKNLSSVRDLFDANTTGLEKLNSLASTIGNLSGRDLTQNFTKSLLQGVGEWLVHTRAVEALGGDKKAITFMQRVDPSYVEGKTYTPDELIPIASNFANLVHGAHDPRTLPGWMLKDTAIQPFFSLASWNISQTNQWMRHVWTPATKGDFTPLIMSTLGAIGGGFVVKELRERLSDKKSAIPSLTQIVNSSRGVEGNIPTLAYNLMAMSSYTGFAGIYSVLGKAAEDLAHKNIPQGAAFPLDEVISNPVHRASQFLSAMMTDENFDYLQAGKKFVFDLAKENIQLGRVGLSWLSNLEGIPGLTNENYLKKLNEKTSELRKFKMVEGMPYEAQSVPSNNPYLDMDEKTFKRTTDLGEAASELPDLIQEAFQKSEKAGGSIDVLRSELGKLKSSPYETMPSPDRMPTSFLRYMMFLNNTQGSDVASERLTDYLTKNALNKVKGKMVPSL